MNNIPSICSLEAIPTPCQLTLHDWSKVGRRMPSLWTRSAFYSTAGQVRTEIIEKYIEKQSTE